MYEALEEQATTDGLTGLVNHRTFQERFSTMLGRADRHELAVSMLLTDIDHFKKINDTYGHPTGDEVLRRVAAILKASARKIDIVARYGGEEFALLLPGADLEAACAVAERCRQRVIDAKIEHRASTTSAWLGVSIGVASQVATPAVDCGVLVEIADAALYRAKRCGRGRIES
jgi:diguanylate cyclase (GGDEF)-like protein